MLLSVKFTNAVVILILMVFISLFLCYVVDLCLFSFHVFVKHDYEYCANIMENKTIPARFYS